MGGSVRSDVQSLLFLRPLSVVVAGFAICTLTRDQIFGHKLPLFIAAAVLTLVSMQLLVVPDALGLAQPQGSFVGEIARKTKVDLAGLPFTLSPLGTANAFFALFVPLAVMLLAIQLDPNETKLLLHAVLALSLASGFIGLLQASGNPNGVLYLYRITNNGFAVGLFANRNHQAILLATLFPALVVYALAGRGSQDENKFRKIVAATLGAMLIPLLLVTGSRAGLLVGIAGIAAAGFIYMRATKNSNNASTLAKILPYSIGAGVIIILVGLSSGMTRALALQRVLSGDAADDLRFSWWPTILNTASNFAPWGSGQGSFAELFRRSEPVALLQPQYVNLVHNDWLETYLTAGWPGLLIAMLTLAILAHGFFRKKLNKGPYSTDKGLAYIGAFCILAFTLSSIFDYPLRTPINASIFAIAIIWTLSSIANPPQRKKVSD